jgi:hypothetical protein
MDSDPRNDGGIGAERLSGWVSEDGRAPHNIADDLDDGTPAVEPEGPPAYGSAEPPVVEEHDEDPEALPWTPDHLDATRRNIELRGGTGIPPEDLSEYSESLQSDGDG